MAVITFENPGNAEPLPECMICCQDILDGEFVKKEYHCTHIFHEECLSEWLQISFLCPACRAFIVEPPLSVAPPDRRRATGRRRADRNRATDRRLQAMRQEWSSRVIVADQLDHNVFENMWRKYLEDSRPKYGAPQNEHPDQQLVLE